MLFGLNYDFRLNQMSKVNGLEFYAQKKFMSRPEKFYKAPVDIKYSESMICDKPEYSYWNISFPSEYIPLYDKFKPQYDSYLENKTVYGRRYRIKGKEDGPVMVIYHGWSEKDLQMTEQVMPINEFAEAGVGIVLLSAPYHMSRKPSQAKFHGEFFMSGDVPRTIEAAAQAVFDARCMIKWLREKEGLKVVGMAGGSMGGYLTSLITVTEPDLDFSIAYVPPARLWELMRGKPIAKYARRGLAASGIDEEMLDSIGAITDPSRFKPKLPKEKILIIAGRADEAVTPDQPLSIWEGWGRPRILWYDGGHTGGAFPSIRRLMFDETRAFLNDIGVIST